MKYRFKCHGLIRNVAVFTEKGEGILGQVDVDL